MLYPIESLLSSTAPLRAQAQAHLRAGEWPQAWDCLSMLVALAPQDAWALQWQVVAAVAVGKAPEAVLAARAALAVLPPEAVQARGEVLFNMGQALGLLGQHALALAAFDELLTLKANDTTALQGRAQAMAALGRQGQATAVAGNALALEPGHKEALAQTANNRVKAGDIEQALKVFLQYESSYPASPFTACMVVFLMRQLANWAWPRLPLNGEEAHLLGQTGPPALPPELALLAHRARQGMPALEPFASLVLYDDPALQRLAAQQLLRHLHPGLAWPPAPAKARQGPLKVAYVSCEFNAHATGFLLAGVLARHDPARVQVFLLSFAPPNKGASDSNNSNSNSNSNSNTPTHHAPDPMAQRFKAMGHTWVDIHALSDAEVAQWCQAQGIDVAVDLKGLTRDNRMGIFAHRAAPVQVNWLGYPGTLPAPYIDWVLADAQVLPPALEAHFAERVWRLPHSYQPNDPDREIAATSGTLAERRASHGLSEGTLVLVCFSNTFKITPKVWAVWMRLLQARPDAVLWLLGGQALAQTHLRGHAQAAGVAPERLVFAPLLPQAQHLARLGLADLSLDTYPCNAHTTASDALWAGVPHVACTGDSFAARVGASVLSAAGMPELIAQGLADYESLALRLVCQDAERCAVRQSLAEKRPTAALWDAGRFAADLETALEGMSAGLAANP